MDTEGSGQCCIQDMSEPCSRSATWNAGMSHSCKKASLEDQFAGIVGCVCLLLTGSEEDSDLSLATGICLRVSVYDVQNGKAEQLDLKKLHPK